RELAGPEGGGDGSVRAGARSSDEAYSWHSLVRVEAAQVRPDGLSPRVGAQSARERRYETIGCPGWPRDPNGRSADHAQLADVLVLLVRDARTLQDEPVALVESPRTGILL